MRTPGCINPIRRLAAVLGLATVAVLPASVTGLATSDLIYQTSNAPVETAPQVYLVFWGTQWQTGFVDTGLYTNTDAQTYISDFFGNVGGSAWNSSQTQYCMGPSVPAGTTSCAGLTTTGHVGNQPNMLAGSWIDPSPVPTMIYDGSVDCNVLVIPRCVDGGPPAIGVDPDIAAEARKAAAHFGYNANANYVILLPPFVKPSGFGTNYCAYHSETQDGSGNVISYTNLPYMPEVSRCGRNFVNPANDVYGHGWFDGYSIVAGHEFAEVETDPRPFSAPAWGPGSSETGDKCAWIPAGSTGGAYNATLGSSYFAVQTLWSNSAFDSTGSGCV